MFKAVFDKKACYMRNESFVELLDWDLTQY